jgi:hypothetical protein
LKINATLSTALGAGIRGCGVSSPGGAAALRQHEIGLQLSVSNRVICRNGGGTTRPQRVDGSVMPPQRCVREGLPEEFANEYCFTSG